MALSHLDDDEISEVTISEVRSDGVRQDRVYKIISESGLYSLILRSRKPEAKEFRRWVTHEVLPSIRKDLPPSDGPATHSPKVVLRR